MSDSTIRILAWSALIIQILVGLAVVRHRAPSSLLVVLNLVAATSVLAYWGRKWFGYLFRGISWSAADQLIPAYALLVCLLALLTLSGRYRGVGVHFWIFGFHTLILLAAALFFSFFRMTRLF
jgi:hypothetical protein